MHALILIVTGINAICERYISLYNSTLIAPKMLNEDDHSTILTASQGSLSMNQREGYKNRYSLIPHPSPHTLENLFTNSEHRKPRLKGLC